MHTTLLLIDSQRASTDRGTTSSSFTWTPSQPLRDVKAIELLQATIPNTALTIAAPHNTLLFGHDTATPATTLTIPPAVYTPETLATVLGTLMTAAASPATYTVAASDGFQFAVSHDAGGGEKTSALCTDLSLCRKLGLTSGTTHVTTNGGAAAPFPGAGCYDLGSPSLYGIRSRALGRDANIDAGPGQQLTFCVPNTEGQGTVVAFHPGSAGAHQRLDYTAAPLRHLPELDLALVDATTGTAVDLRAHWSLLLRCHHGC